MKNQRIRYRPWLLGGYAAVLVLCLAVTLAICIQHPDASSSSIYLPALRTAAGEPLELPALTWANGAILVLTLGRLVIELFRDDPEEDYRETSPSLKKQRRRAYGIWCAAYGGAVVLSFLLRRILGGTIWLYFAGQCCLVALSLSWDFRRWYLDRAVDG